MSPTDRAAARGYVQASFDELGEPLREVTFVVFDLETTGTSPVASAITEIGAVKVRGGEVVAEFATLVDPGLGIPPFITVLTGITDSMVAQAPRIDSVLPSFLEFARDCVLVAHNAPFDLGFMKAACEAHGYPWPGFRSVDTAVLARRVLSRDEAPNCKLGTLAMVLGARTRPTHRALDDARATVDVLHSLFERVGALGVQSLDELRTFTFQVSPQQRRKRHLAEPLPHSPGVYVFRGPKDEALYVGKSRDIRSRVRSYFVSSENRSRMAEMVGLAQRVDPIVCAHDLEAEVRELRLIGEHKPRYNRRSKFPERQSWLKLTDEPFPRLSIVRAVRDDGGCYLGPFGSKHAAEQAMTAVLEALPIRQCSGRLPLRPSRTACALAEMHRCGAPCDGSETVEQYAVHSAVFTAAVAGDVRPLVAPLLRRIERLASSERYEEAAASRDRLAAFVRACARQQRLIALTRIPEMVAARPDGHGGWELSVVRHGRLVAAGVAPRGAAPWPYIDALRASAETVLPQLWPLPVASAEETECILRWLEKPGSRLVAADAEWACPVHGAGMLRGWLEAVEAGRGADEPFADRRALHPVARPARATA
ncbi:MAG TPA: DEDD exonuclease domain-containing protein [Mycobacteriales bacterium]|jgi:DNA polymerase-3 subunit epsilon|nr:DEDD exonuclease domain-containing protein [Mycobacteriales bacterium]